MLAHRTHEGCRRASKEPEPKEGASNGIFLFPWAGKSDILYCILIFDPESREPDGTSSRGGPGGAGSLGGQTFTTEGLEAIRRFIVDQHFFLPRAQAEYDATVKQIIPYVLLRRGDAYFLLRRLKKQTETRLHDKLSLGVGGHINPTETPHSAQPMSARNGMVDRTAVK